MGSMFALLCCTLVSVFICVLISHGCTHAPALVVDEELHPDKVTKLLSTRGKHLCVEFAACDARMLRVSVNSFFDMTALATQTLDAF